VGTKGKASTDGSYYGNKSVRKGEPSQYSQALRFLEREAREKKQRQKRERGENICGSKKRTGGVCRLHAGWGTNHLGVGRCRKHGGSVPSHVKSAAGDELRILLGKPVEINPLDGQAVSSVCP
jgi:hypothetical protein